MEDIKNVWEDIKNKTKLEYDISDPAYRTFILPLQIESVENDIINIVIPYEQNEGIGIDYYNKKYIQI